MRAFRSVPVWCLMLIVASSSAFANEQEDKGHIQPGSRPIAHTEWMEIQQQRADEDEKRDEEATQEPAEAEEGRVAAAVVKAGTHFTSHTGAFHNPIAVSPLGEQVELEDGSIWKISGGDSYKTLNWLTTDLIVVTPNHDWFSSYMFCMTNQQTGVTCRCNMTLGPIYNGVYTHWIVAINYYTQEICLEDGSIWNVSGFDSSIFNKWLVNDTIFIGVNDGFLSSSKPNMLINVNTLTWVRAKCTW